MRVLWLPALILLPLALTACPAMLSDWTIGGSGAADASTDTSQGGGGASSRSGGSSGSGTGGSVSGGDVSGAGGATISSGGTSSGGVTAVGGTTSTGGSPEAGGAGGAMATGGAGGATPSCKGLPATCGPAGNESCCSSPLVMGGTFYRSYDGVSSGFTSQAYPATVSNFRLDKYEITVGRFRKFVAAYSQSMIAAGAGKNPNNASDSGWDTAWNTGLPASAAALQTAIACDSTYQTWTPSAGSNEDKPINCIDWYEAFAFCIWDGGRLPTEAEWNYAAAGGSEQRVYPWSSPATSTTIDCTYANYSYNTGSCTNSSANNVGSESPKDNGKWGQADLAGNVGEWNLDFYASPYPQVSCANCANTTATTLRVIRGGTFNGGPTPSSFRVFGGLGDRANNYGSRCARRAP